MTTKKTNINSNSKAAHSALLIFIAIVSGFFGGWFGSRSEIISKHSSHQAAYQREITDSSGKLINKIVEDVGPSVVSINVTSVGTTQDFFGFGRKIEQKSAGTGVIISKDGLIITNRHVISSDTSTVSITLSDGSELDKVKIVGRTNDSDPLDVAFLKILDNEGHELTPAKLGDSSSVQVGDSVIAIGNALGQFQNTVTSGIISGFGRDIQASAGYGRSSETLQNLFQTDAAINSGNSGGPLVNSNSEVIGINVATASADNISFSIPINDIKGLIDTVKEQGKLIRPFLGVRYVSITDDIASNLDLPVKRGAYIPEGTKEQPTVLKNSPAEKAGLKEMDIIIEIEGQKLDEKNSVVSILGQRKVGDSISIKVLREGKELTFSIKLEAAPEQ